MPGAEQNLRDGLHALQLELNAQQVGQLLDYLALIGKWTKVYNLTAVRDPADMMTLHILDSLAAIAPPKPHLPPSGLGEGGRLRAAGSGPGRPAVGAFRGAGAPTCRCR